MSKATPKNPVILLLADLQFGKSIFYDHQINDDAKFDSAKLTNAVLAMEIKAALSSLLNDIRRYEVDAIPRPTVIVIAGDIIYGKYHATPKSAKALYKAAGQFIKQIMKKLNIKETSVVVVPGNHDGKVDGTRASFDSYKVFCKENDLIYVKKYQHRRLNDYGIIFHAYNTATEISNGRIKGKIDKNLLEQDKKTELLNIAVWHHNPRQADYAFASWTDNHGENLTRNFHILLHGHTHKYDADVKIKGHNVNFCSIGSGAFGAHHNDRIGFTGDRGPAVNSYTIVEINKSHNYIRLFSRMYDPVLRDWVPHNTYETTEGRYEDRIMLNLNNYTSSDIAVPTLLIGDDVIRSSIRAACADAGVIEFYGKLDGNKLQDVGINPTKNIIHFHSCDFKDMKFHEENKCKYISLKSQDWLIEFYKANSFINPKPFKSILITGNAPRFAYSFSNIAFSELFAMDAIELNHERQFGQLNAVVKFRDNIGMRLVEEWSDGFYDPPFPDAMKIENADDWQRVILTNYAAFGKKIFSEKKKKKNGLTEILITWELSYDARNSLINVDSIKGFIEEFNKSSQKKTRIFFVDDADILRDIAIDSITEKSIRDLVPATAIKNGNCKFAILAELILSNKILKGFKGDRFFVACTAINSIDSLKNNIKDIAFYLADNNEIIMVQDSKLISAVLSSKNQNGDGEKEILKVFFRRKKKEDIETVETYRKILIKKDFKLLNSPYEYSDTVFKSFKDLCKNKLKGDYAAHLSVMDDIE